MFNDLIKTYASLLSEDKAIVLHLVTVIITDKCEKLDGFIHGSKCPTTCKISYLPSNSRHEHARFISLTSLIREHFLATTYTMTCCFYIIIAFNNERL